MSEKPPLLERLLPLVTPTKPIHWPLGVILWGFVAAFFGVGVEYAVMGELDDTLVDHITLTILIAAPFVLLVMAMFAHLSRLQSELVRLAATDMLTGLPNRRTFMEKANTASGGVILMLDVDHFKRVNDRYGHAVGDKVLVAVADQLRSAIREEDLVGRMGGEEFAVYLVGATTEQARVIGERISNGVTYAPEAEGRKLKVTISVGAAPSNVPPDVGKMLKKADEALYSAKAEGRARLVFWAPKLARDDALSEPFQVDYALGQDAA